MIVREKFPSEKHDGGMFRASPPTDRGMGLCEHCILLGQKGTPCSTPCIAHKVHKALLLELVAEPECFLQKVHSILLQFILDHLLFFLYFHNSWHSVQK